MSDGCLRLDGSSGYSTLIVGHKKFCSELDKRYLWLESVWGLAV
jgi:hypothetical protein